MLWLVVCVKGGVACSAAHLFADLSVKRIQETPPPYMYSRNHTKPACANPHTSPRINSPHSHTPSP